MGDAAQLVQQGGAVASPIVGAAAGSSVASVLGISTAVAVPLIGAAIVGVTIAITMLLRSGCGKSCVITSNWANEAEALLLKNIQAYFAIPAPRTRLQQQAALENFDKIWNYLASECATVPGRAGEDCIKDRKAGACEWKQTADSILLKYPGEPQPGQCWNWHSGYRDPIANDTQVTDATSQTDTGVAQTLTNAGAQLAQLAETSPLLLIGGALLIGAFLMGGKKD